MQRKRVFLATALATLVMASPAAANPFTDVGPFSGPGGQVTVAGANTAAPAQIDWDVFGGVPHPVLTGRLFMDSVPNAQARVRVQYYDDAINHAFLNTRSDPLRQGVAGIAAFGVNVGPEAGSAHAHVEIVVNGTVVRTALCTMGDPTCTIVP